MMAASSAASAAMAAAAAHSCRRRYSHCNATSADQLRQQLHACDLICPSNRMGEAVRLHEEYELILTIQTVEHSFMSHIQACFASRLQSAQELSGSIDCRASERACSSTEFGCRTICKASYCTVSGASSSLGS